MLSSPFPLFCFHLLAFCPDHQFLNLTLLNLILDSPLLKQHIHKISFLQLVARASAMAIAAWLSESVAAALWCNSVSK